MKKLNRKGFTLIELLAVIVILAVVMGIAANSVLNSMNKARGGSLLDSAQVIARGMDQRLMAVQVDGTSTITGTSLVVGTTGASYISEAVGKEYGLNATDYLFADSGGPSVTSTSQATASFIYYNSTNNSFIVCLLATTGGKNDVAAYRKSKHNLVQVVSGSSPKYIQSSATAVVAGCSDGTNTWSN